RIDSRDAVRLGQQLTSLDGRCGSNKIQVGDLPRRADVDEDVGAARRRAARSLYGERGHPERQETGVGDGLRYPTTRRALVFAARQQRPAPRVDGARAVV